MEYDLAVVGGLGPLASNCFLNTLYRVASNQVTDEQSMPNILLCSLPKIPDRTKASTLGQHTQLLSWVKKHLSKIRAIHSKKIIFCCFTIYGFLSQLSPEEQNNIISLPDLLLQKIIQKQQKTLMLCTEGARSLSIFESSSYWEKAKKLIVFCNEIDQKRVHQLIYELKMDKLEQGHFEYINQLVKQYSVSCWAAACTEFHLLTSASHFGTIHTSLVPFIDPLLEFALTFNDFAKTNTVRSISSEKIA